jgi:hypothetical protein
MPALKKPAGIRNHGGGYMLSSTRNKAAGRFEIDTPDPLTLALHEAESILARCDRLKAVLHETGRTIPAALAEERELANKLGLAEVTGDGNAQALRSRLSIIGSERTAAARKRSSASEGLSLLESDVAEARRSLERARTEVAASVRGEFTQRWSATCQHMHLLLAEAKALTEAGVPVLTPPPFQAEINRIHGHAELTPVASATRVEAPALPPQLAAIAGLISRLDDAGSICRAIRDAGNLSKHYFSRNLQRGGMPNDLSRVFVVAKSFSALGSEFPVNSLITREILPDGLLDRFVVSRCLRQADAGIAA